MREVESRESRNNSLQRFSDRDCAVACDTTVRRSELRCIGRYNGSPIGIVG